MDTKEFKGVIEDIVDARMSKKGITKFVSAVVKTVNSNGSVDVYLPPDTEKIVSGVLNKTGENLSVGDSVELCTKNGKTSNAWVSVKHGTNFNVGKQITDTGWLYSSNVHSSDLGSIGQFGTVYGRKINNSVELNFDLRFDGGEEDINFTLSEDFRPIQNIYAQLTMIEQDIDDSLVVLISISTSGKIGIVNDNVKNRILETATHIYLRGNVMYFV